MSDVSILVNSATANTPSGGAAATPLRMLMGCGQ